MTTTPHRVATEWRIYRFYDAAGNLLYLGQTRQGGLRRLCQHLDEKPWADEIAAHIVDPGRWHSEEAVLAAERDAIHTERPRYNIAHNGRNPHRVTIPRQRTGRAPAARTASRRTSALRRWARSVPLPVYLWSGAWLGLTVGIAQDVVPTSGVVAGIGSAAVGATAVLAGCRYAWRRLTKPRRRRRTRW